MYYITLDLEWNQAYAQKALAVQKQLSSRLRGEVIQIGAVKLDRNMVPCGSYSVIIKPKFFKKIHRHVSELTGISQEMMNRGMPLSQAAEGFRRFCGEDFCFLTWGPDDVPMLKDNFRVNDLPSDWLDKTYDLQVIFNRQTDDSTKQRSLEYAMEYFEIPQTLPAHDALNDAYFTALVAAKLDVAEGIREYRAVMGDILESSVIGDADAGDDGYVTIGELFADECVASPVCPICKKPLTRKDKPLHSRGQRFCVLCRCEKDGDMFLTLKLHRNFNDTWRAKRVIAPATEEQIIEYKHKLNENAIRRKSRNRRSGMKRKPQTPDTSENKD
ncbi:MAG: exonuclease domain-containing protein [Clostridia bacterium]|nr:exonuclease domain-containing protein [Clostridia bacterium]